MQQCVLTGNETRADVQRGAGVRYIQAPLCTPRERLNRMGSIILHHADLPPSRMPSRDQAGHAIPDTDPLTADWLPVTIWRSREDMAAHPPEAGWQVNWAPVGPERYP